MTTDLDGPADTRMMGVVHSAMRRDLVRTRLVLTGAQPVEDARRRAIAGHLRWMMDFLHHHHEGEDTGLYPMVRAKDPALVPVLDKMDAEHRAIHPGMAAVDEAAAAWEQDPDRRADVLGALDQLEASLLPHLEQEERDMMPLVQRTITHREWRDWDEATNVRSKPKPQLATEGHWLLDNLDPASRDLVVHLVPPVPRFLLVRLMGGPYRARRRAMWGGTPAEHVRSEVLQPRAARG